MPEVPEMPQVPPAPAPVPEEVAVSVDDGIATLALRRPAKRNAVTYDMWLAIAEHCRALARDPSVRVLLVRGEGAHFCAGADIAGLADADQPSTRPPMPPPTRRSRRSPSRPSRSSPARASAAAPSCGGRLRT